MGSFKLIKDVETQTQIQIFKDGTYIDLKREIWDSEKQAGWGGQVGEPDQIAFAIAYTMLGDRDMAIEKYPLIANIISNAAPYELEISTEVIALMLA
jgi:hypothetical protein